MSEWTKFVDPDSEELPATIDLKEIRESLEVAEKLASAALLTSSAAKRRLAARKFDFEQEYSSTIDYVPPKQVLIYLVRMGSFSSTPKVDNSDSCDDEIIKSFHPCSKEDFLLRCIQEVLQAGRPSLLKRSMRILKDNLQHPLRVFQWNILSQCLGTSNDNFVKCPPEALEWSSRRFLILQEIVQCDPDIVCLQEVDHYNFLEAALGSIGYAGTFFPKPDSPCVYLEGNNGPDGCAIFHKLNRLELLNTQTRILEVWRVQSNQVAIAQILRDKATNREFLIATTHLKARSGALLAALRENQGRDLVDWMQSYAAGRPMLLTGDFNAEPTEPVYRLLTTGRKAFISAYRVAEGKEPDYTTWKIREEGEVCHTIDYVFHSASMETGAILDFPSGDELGKGRAPSMNYPSDHFSLVADLSFSSSNY